MTASGPGKPGRLAPTAGDSRGGDGEQRPQALAASVDQVIGQGRDHRHRALHARHNQGVDAGHVRRGQLHQRVHGAGRTVDDGSGGVQLTELLEDKGPRALRCGATMLARYNRVKPDEGEDEGR